MIGFGWCLRTDFILGLGCIFVEVLFCCCGFEGVVVLEVCFCLFYLMIVLI